MSIKRNFLGQFSLLIVATLLLATSCNNTDDNSTSTTAKVGLDLPQENISMPLVAVKPPIPNVDVPYLTCKIPVSKGGQIETSTGTTVEVPPNAFVDKDGNPVKGEVEIKFREFHDAADIIVSGIPMHNPETGEFMETGGMFEILGEQKGKEIFIAAEKDIQVNLASFNEGDDFNFFQLGQEDLHWDDKGLASAEQPNLKKIKELAQLDKKKPSKPLRPLKKSGVNGRQLFDLDVNYTRFPTLKAFSSVVWQYSGEGVNIEKEKWVFESDWDRINISKAENGFFELKLSNKDKTIKTYIQPVLQDDDYEAALAVFTERTMKKYQDLVEVQRIRREQLANQSNMYRSLSVSGFGIHNCDIWGKIPNVVCLANFDFDEHAGVDAEDAKDITVFLVMKDRKAVVPYRCKIAKSNRFNFPSTGNNALVAVLPKGRVAMFTASDFANVDGAEVRKTSRLTVEMRTSDTYLESKEDLSLILDYAMAN